MYKYWYHPDYKKITKQRVRQIVTIGLPEIILPVHVAQFDIIPLIDPPKPECSSIQEVVDGGIVIEGQIATQVWMAGPIGTDEEIDSILTKEIEQQEQQEQRLILRALEDIDFKSIRSIREYISAKPDAPPILIEYEAEAVEKRKKVKN